MSTFLPRRSGILFFLDRWPDLHFDRRFACRQGGPNPGLEIRGFPVRTVPPRSHLDIAAGDSGILPDRMMDGLLNPHPRSFCVVGAVG